MKSYRDWVNYKVHKINLKLEAKIRIISKELPAHDE